MKFVKRNVREELKKSWFHIALLASFSVSITALMVLDYLDIEGGLQLNFFEFFVVKRDLIPLFNK